MLARRWAVFLLTDGGCGCKVVQVFKNKLNKAPYRQLDQASDGVCVLGCCFFVMGHGPSWAVVHKGHHVKAVVHCTETVRMPLLFYFGRISALVPPDEITDGPSGWSYSRVHMIWALGVWWAHRPCVGLGVGPPACVLTLRALTRGYHDVVHHGHNTWIWGHTTWHVLGSIKKGGIRDAITVSGEPAAREVEAVCNCTYMFCRHRFKHSAS